MGVGVLVLVEVGRGVVVPVGVAVLAIVGGPVIVFVDVGSGVSVGVFDRIGFETGEGSNDDEGWVVQLHSHARSRINARGFLISSPPFFVLERL